MVGFSLIRRLFQFAGLFFGGFNNFLLELCFQVGQIFIAMSWENIGKLLEVWEHVIESARTIKERLNGDRGAGQDSTQFLRNTFMQRDICDDEAGNTSKRAERFREIATQRFLKVEQEGRIVPFA